MFYLVFYFVSVTLSTNMLLFYSLLHHYILLVYIGLPECQIAAHDAYQKSQEMKKINNFAPRLVSMLLDKFKQILTGIPHKGNNDVRSFIQIHTLYQNHK